MHVERMQNKQNMQQQKTIEEKQNMLPLGKNSKWILPQKHTYE